MDDSVSGRGGSDATVGDEPAAWFELDDAEWYDLDEDVAAALCSEADTVFLRTLRRRAESGEWACDPEDTQARHFREGGRGALVVLLMLADEEEVRHLLTFGVVFDGTGIVGDEMPGQTYEFGGVTPARLAASGPAAELASMAADWFEKVLAWRIERREWGTLARPEYQEWVVIEPDGERCLVATAGGRPAGPPDKISHVRGRR